MTQKEKEQKQQDDAVRSLAVYRELKIRLEEAARRSMATYNAVQLYVKADLEVPKDVINDGVSALLQLEELEATMAGFIDAGFPAPIYERPDLDKKIEPEKGDAWAEWRKEANIIQNNNDTGKRGGY